MPQNPQPVEECNLLRSHHKQNGESMKFNACRFRNLMKFKEGAIDNPLSKEDALGFETREQSSQPLLRQMQNETVSVGWGRSLP